MHRRTARTGRRSTSCPLAGGEARRLTDLPRGVDAFAWSPDGRSLVVRTTSFGATRADDRKARGKAELPKPGATPLSDYRYFDRLQGMLNGPGFIDDKVAHLWLVDVETGAARRLTDGPTSDAEPAWSPDGTRIAFTASRGRDHDLDYQFDVFVVEVATGQVTRITDGTRLRVRQRRLAPGRRDAGSRRAPLSAGRRQPQRRLALRRRRLGGPPGRGPQPLRAQRPDVRRRAWGATSRRARPPGSGDAGRRAISSSRHRSAARTSCGGSPSPTARWSASPRTATTCRAGRSSRRPAGGARVAAIRSTATALSDVHILDLGGRRAPAASRRSPAASRRSTTHVLAELDVRAPGGALGDGRRPRDPGLAHPLLPRPERGEPAPLVLQIHGGPHTLYGWAPYWEFQVLAGAGDQRPLHQPARVGGVRRGLQQRQPPGLGRRARCAT